MDKLEKYCSPRFRTGEELDEALDAALCSCTDAERAEKAAEEAHISEHNADVYAEGGTPLTHDGQMILPEPMPGAKGYMEQAQQHAEAAQQAAEDAQQTVDSITIDVDEIHQAAEVAKQCAEDAERAAQSVVDVSDSATAAIAAAAVAEQSAAAAAESAQQASSQRFRASMYAVNAEAYSEGGIPQRDVGGGTFMDDMPTLGSKGYAAQAQVYTEGGEAPMTPPQFGNEVLISDGAKNFADRAAAFAVGGDYREYYRGGTWKTLRVEKGAMQYAEEAARIKDETDGVADEVKTAKKNADNAADRASASEVAAEAAADKAGESATLAQAGAKDALAYADEATKQAAFAAQGQLVSEEFSKNSKAYAEGGTPVEYLGGTSFKQLDPVPGAKYYMEQAQGLASAAAGSASEAAGSAVEAELAQSTAVGAADRASASEVAAEAAAAAAAKSAEEAKNAAASGGGGGGGSGGGSGGGDCDWNTMKNKPFYSELVDILPEETITASEEMDGVAVIFTPFSLTSGKTYVVVWNGVEYTCTALDADGVCVGNVGALTGGADTGEPFVIANAPAEEAAEYGFYGAAFPLDGSTEVTLSIKAEVVKTIDTKYLPEALRFGDKKFDVEVLPEETFAVEGEENPISTPFSLTSGDTYLVTWNGAEYTCVAQTQPMEDIGAAFVVGNVAMLNGTGDTGEPFVVLAFPGALAAEFGMGGGFIPLDGSTEVTLSIKGASFTPIDSKYLPEALQFGKTSIQTPEVTVEFTSGEFNAPYQPTLGLVAGQEWVVTWNGTEYTCKAEIFAEGDTTGVVVGNLGFILGGELTGEPFIILDAPALGGGIVFSLIGESSATFSARSDSVKRISGEYLLAGLPFVEYFDEPVLPITIVDISAEIGYITVPVGEVVVGRTYTVQYGAYQYTSVAEVADFQGSVPSIRLPFTDTDYPELEGQGVYIFDTPQDGVVGVVTTPGTTGGTRSVSIDGGYDIHKIDERCLPDGLGGGIEVPVATPESDGLMSAADKEKLDGFDGVVGVGAKGTGLNAEVFNGGTGSASGAYSHAEGEITTACGQTAHAEGRATVAYGEQSHAEGAGMPETVYVSHERRNGYSRLTLKDPYAIRKGDLVRFANSYSRVISEGVTGELVVCYPEFSSADAGDIAVNVLVGAASGECAHSEGYHCAANGSYSHAEGYRVKANSSYQHAQGRYNVVDPDGVYAHIVGNGKSFTERANAHTLDWDGNAWFSGDVYVKSTSGTNKDEGSKKLATEAYVNNLVGSGGGGGSGNLLFEQELDFSSSTVVNLHNTNVDLVAGETYDVYWNGEKYSCVAQYHEDTEMPALGLGNGDIGSIWDFTGNGEPFLLVVMLATENANSTTSIMVEKSGQTANMTVWKFEPANSIILRSSTSGSTKLFKITVDDSGNLKATQLV